MDIIGVGSLPIVILIGFFSGFVITMQMSRALSHTAPRTRWARLWLSRWFVSWVRC